MTYFTSRYAAFIALVIPALQTEEMATRAGKFLDAAALACNEQAVAIGINLASDPIRDQVASYVAYVYHGAPKPRWVAFSEM